MTDQIEIKIDIVTTEPTVIAHENSKEADIEHGGHIGTEDAGVPIDNTADEHGAEGEEELTLMHYAETIEVIDFGCFMKSKTGVAGESPEKDSFPFFKANKRFVCLMWAGDVQDWRLLSFEGDRPEDIYDPEQAFKASYIMLKDINEVFLENEPSCSFRLYSGENVVTRYTPQPEDRGHADAWVNAIFAAMELQGTENDPADLAELRKKYLDSFEDIPETENHDGAVVEQNAAAAAGNIDLEAGEGAPVDKRRYSTGTQRSAFDFTHIYGHANANPDAPQHKSCCILS